MDTATETPQSSERPKNPDLRYDIKKHSESFIFPPRYIHKRYHSGMTRNIENKTAFGREKIKKFNNGMFMGNQDGSMSDVAVRFQVLLGSQSAEANEPTKHIQEGRRRANGIRALIIKPTTENPDFIGFVGDNRELPPEGSKETPVLEQDGKELVIKRGKGYEVRIKEADFKAGGSYPIRMNERVSVVIEDFNPENGTVTFGRGSTPELFPVPGVIPEKLPNGTIGEKPKQLWGTKAKDLIIRLVCGLPLLQGTDEPNLPPTQIEPPPTEISRPFPTLEATPFATPATPTSPPTVDIERLRPTQTPTPTPRVEVPTATPREPVIPPTPDLDLGNPAYPVSTPGKPLPPGGPAPIQIPRENNENRPPGVVVPNKLPVTGDGSTAR